MKEMLGNVCRQCHMVDYSHDGLCVIEDSQLLGHSQIKGFLQAKKVKFDKISLLGSGYFDGCQVESEALFYGQVSLHHCYFKKKMTLHAQSSKADYSIFHHIDLIDEKRGAFLELTSSVVHGDIHFHGQGGRVFLHQGSVVHGEVINGDLIKEEE